MKYTNVSAQDYEPGVSLELAKNRKNKISNVTYKLSFSIPERMSAAVTGAVFTNFDYKKDGKDLILDFQNISKHLLSLSVNGKNNAYVYKNEHIIIKDENLIEGKNAIDIKFISGNSSLNRNETYLYTLFVPDKASIVFPCFDQPDIKAKYDLELSIPEKWIAMSNGGIISENVENGIRNYKFAETKPISTYHFAFMAGEFQKLSKTKGNRTINFYHTEKDPGKVKRNADTIFDMHFMAIDWMEKYTGIKYPFEKLDFAAIPSFQFSGMEHVGAIYYRKSRLFLSESASIEDVLKRAKVITHEASHMWFGDLVTMKWFDDVWLKEVYAELMAGKMVNPMFPGMNHDLNFITSNFPRAYQTDRTLGTHPIQQKLENLKFAGTLYGDIIYYKAPIVMAKLEHIVGGVAMQEGLKEYLHKYEYGNAAWNDLIEIFDKYTRVDLNQWSKTWVEQDGMPTIYAEIEYNNGKISKFKLKQKDPLGKGRIWKQSIEILWNKSGENRFFPVYMDSEELDVTGIVGHDEPDFILLNGGGYGYGYFEIDKKNKKYLLENIHLIKDEVTRTIAYITFFQALVNYNLSPKEFINKMMAALKSETAKENFQMVLDNVELCWWFFLKQEERLELVNEVEGGLFKLAENIENNEAKSAVFQILLSVFVSKDAEDFFYKLWENNDKFYGLKPSGTDYSTIALALSLRDYPGADSILNEQLARINDCDRKERMKFIMPAVSADEKVRDKFFESLQKPENRQQEIWVRSGLYYLNHPLRAEYSVKYLPKTLGMLEEIQKTGDIFFPKNWLAYSVGRYNTAEAVKIVTQFLDENPDYNKNLKDKILQLSDYLFRAEKINENEEQYGNKAPGFKSGNE